MEIGAYDDLTEKIYEMWIFAQLKSGKVIKIYDPLFDLRHYINQIMKLLIDIEGIYDIHTDPSHFPKDSKYNLIKGIFIEEYITPKEWTESLLYDDDNDDYSALKTEISYFRLYQKNIEKFRLKEGHEVVIEVYRFDLRAWSQVE